MKKNFIYLILIITLINLTALGTIIYQRWLNPKVSTCESIREIKFEKVKRELALTSSQIELFQEIRSDFHFRIDSLNQLLEGINRVLQQEIWQPQPDTARIDSLLNRISQLQMKSQHLVIHHFYQFKEILTDDQWQRFYFIVAEHFPGRLNNPALRQQSQSEKDKQ